MADVESFANDLQAFLRHMNATAAPVESPLRRRLRDHLGEDPTSLPIVGEEIPTYERANLQLAIEAWAEADARRVVTPLGYGSPNRFAGVELADIASLSPATGITITEGPVNYVEAALAGGDRKLCFQNVLLLITVGDKRVVALVGRAQQRSPAGPPIVVQIMADDERTAGEIMAEWRQLRRDLNVYRGRVLSVAQGDRNNPFGDSLDLTFVDLQLQPRSSVILGEGVLERVERHTIDFAKNAARLVAAGRSLRRGVLLYGPPGTGKTHTVRYLAQAFDAPRTTFVVSGAAFAVLPPICRMARDLAPATIVLEDVDLVAAERMVPGRSHTLLFELMNEMDGLAADIDVLFVMTTNRADLLEPALSMRPGRVDLAVEIALPDVDCRRRLVELYRRPMQLDAAIIDTIVERTEGASAAFIKELLRRATLIAATADPSAPLDRLAGAHVDQALAELLEAGGSLTRALLGAASPHDDAAPRARLPPGMPLPPGFNPGVPRVFHTRIPGEG